MGDYSEYQAEIDQAKARVRAECPELGDREVRIKLLPGGDWTGYLAVEAQKWLLAQEEGKEAATRRIMKVGTWAAALAALFGLVQLFR